MSAATDEGGGDAQAAEAEEEEAEVADFMEAPPPPSPGTAAIRLRDWETRLDPRMYLRRVLQLTWLLGARGLAEIRTRHGAGELGALPPRELLALVRALFERAALEADVDARVFMRALEEEAAAAGVEAEIE